MRQPHGLLRSWWRSERSRSTAGRDGFERHAGRARSFGRLLHHRSIATWGDRRVICRRANARTGRAVASRRRGARRDRIVASSAWAVRLRRCRLSGRRRSRRGRISGWRIGAGRVVRGAWIGGIAIFDLGASGRWRRVRRRRRIGRIASSSSAVARRAVAVIRSHCSGSSRRIVGSGGRRVIRSCGRRRIATTWRRRCAVGASSAIRLRGGSVRLARSTIRRRRRASRIVLASSILTTSSVRRR